MKKVLFSVMFVTIVFIFASCTDLYYNMLRSDGDKYALSADGQKYGITYYVDGKVEVLAPQTFTKSTLPLDLPRYAGISGWYDNPACQGSPITQLAAGTTLENKSFYLETDHQTTYVTIRFNANAPADEITGTMPDQREVKNSDISLPASAFSRAGYTFSGWAESSTGAKLPSPYKAVADVTLYALWIKTSFTQKDYDSRNSFEVSTPKQLESLAELSKNKENDFAGKTITLQSDIDFGDGTVPNFTGIATGNAALTFKGTFDGKGHEVKNMHIAGDSQFIGFFGRVDGGTIENFGIGSGSTITSTANTVGGIVGYLINSTLKNSYNMADIKASYAAGGLAGVLVGTSSISKSYNIGKIETSLLDDHTGALAGSAEAGGEKKEISNSFYLEGSAPSMVGANDTGVDIATSKALAAAEFGTDAVFTAAGWDFTTVWEMGDTGRSDVLRAPVLRKK